jgi:hypothetical protein
MAKKVSRKKGFLVLRDRFGVDRDALVAVFLPLLNRHATTGP